MRRWHAPRERTIMLRRWRLELANHGYEYGWPYPHCSPAPPGAAAGVDCHCARGIGTMRKQRPYGCGNARCCVCHREKFVEPKRRAATRRKAIELELAASA